MANYGFDPRTLYNLIGPPIELISQQNNDAELERFFTVHKLIVGQLHIAKAKQKNIMQINAQHPNNSTSVKESSC